MYLYLYPMFARRYMHSHAKSIIVYTDGSFYNHPKKPYGGIGLFFPNREHANIAENYATWEPKIPPTSHRCELVAIYRAMAICLYLKRPAFIYTDSLTAVHGITGVSIPKSNLDLYDPMRVAYARAQYPLSLLHVTTNSDLHSLGNSFAHALAVYGAKKIE